MSDTASDEVSLELILFGIGQLYRAVFVISCKHFRYCFVYFTDC